MNGLVLTQSDTFIIGFIAKLLGYVMEGIFYVLDLIGIPNIGLSIIIFTIVIYLLLMPLTIKQQKFSKLSAKMNPELTAIREKYKGKKDNDSMAAMNQETQAVYNKYGVSPTGGCVQLLIQMPILFALYQVIYRMPAYVTKIKEAFFPLVDELIKQPGSAEFIQTFKNASYYAKQFTNESFTSGVTTYVQNTYVDVLNKASTSELLSIGTQYPSLKDHVENTVSLLGRFNNFLGINIANSPSVMVHEALDSKAYLMVAAAFIIPILSAVTQWINTKLMPQQAPSNDPQANSMASSMKTMNIMMPLMSAFFCYTLPAGMGIYWIAGAVVRSIQQIIINKHIDKMDLDELIKTNVEKRNKKLAKAGIDPNKVNNIATMKTKNISSIANSVNKSDSNNAPKSAPKAGSIAAKANMVREYNEKNNK
ncbi:MAG: YidC/Oxa1 family membrane protein insertase [Lachnospiraceae bacterium]|jgi:YidC/Oxa1 family membrane protein insertase|nr:YidC/Oxa1 family membrane protein insertase [Lachnospiraceae bacterium]